MNSKKKSFLSNHSLFTNKKTIQSKEDLINKKIKQYGEKIIIDIPINTIETKPQVRKTFDQSKIDLLAQDIDSKGLIHPVTVMNNPNNKNSFILIIGGNRLEAFKKLKKKTIPAIIKEFSDNEGDLQLLQLAENMHRNDLNPVELAEALASIKKITGLTLDQIAKTVGRSLDSIKQYSRISNLSKKEKDFHIRQKSTKNEILHYLAKKSKNSNDKKTLEFIKIEDKSKKTNKKITESDKKILLKQITDAEKFISETKKILLENT